MSALDGHVADYLRLRRAFGFKLHRPAQLLPQFVAYLDAAGTQTITVELAVAWARLPEGVQPIEWAHRLSAVRGFARYLHTIDPVTEIPPAGVFAARQQRPTPYIYTPAEVAALLRAARRLHPPLRAATHECLFGLLAVSGMRVGEAIGLARADVDLTEGVVRVRHPKFDRDRLVPLHPSATDALRAYVKHRDRLCPAPRSDAFFCSSVGTTLGYSGVRETFIKISTAIGLRTATSKPRIHDLRHSLAVHTLIDWQRDGVDIAAGLPVLSTYLGHLNPANTYWYLSAVPELMQPAAARLHEWSTRASGDPS